MAEQDKEEEEPAAPELANGSSVVDAPADGESTAESTGESTGGATALLEARAIAQAMESADASYVPSPSLLAADAPLPLLAQVDGPSLGQLGGTPGVYQAKAVPVALRARFDVPIHVTAGGSVVEYSISTALYDIAFGVTAEREEGVTTVKESARVDSHAEAVTGKFLVGSVPCALVFAFDNAYSWFREKRVTYTITVTPPDRDSVVRGRRLRARKALEVVARERSELEKRRAAATERGAQLAAEVRRLEKNLAEKQKSLDVVRTEEAWLEKKQGVRVQQIQMLNARLDKGWDDEHEQAEA